MPRPKIQQLEWLGITIIFIADEHLEIDFYGEEVILEPGDVSICFTMRNCNDIKVKHINKEEFEILMKASEIVNKIGESV